MRSILIDQVASSVSQLVCHTSEPCKNGKTDRNALWTEDSGGPRKPLLDWGPDPPMGKGNFEGEGAAHCKVYRHFAATSTKTD